MITIKIDGREATCEKGEFLMEVAKRNGIDIPSLCYHEGLLGIGSCRVCICEVVERGRSKVVTSCVYPIERECEVQTASPLIVKQRGVIVALLAHLAPQSEEIQELARTIGADMPLLRDKDGGEKCILCGRCTVACEALGTGAIAKVNRGVGKEIATAFFGESTECVGCTSCASVCPTGSIEVQETEDTRTIWGREFRLARCEVCGAIIGTEESVAYADNQLVELMEMDTPGVKGAGQPMLCSLHKRQLIAEGFDVAAA
jgi:NADH dehydrogenase/NADH:ubiquinone oxidoreductase subunit G